jgi:hypothetical protein
MQYKRVTQRRCHEKLSLVTKKITSYLQNSLQHLKVMKKIKLLFLCAIFISCKSTVINTSDDINKINSTLDQWNIAAAKADYNSYFNYLTDDAIFIGTDATEHWDKKSFMAFAKPYFDKGKAWDFTSLQRHIYFDTTHQTAWFDELLNTQMKICRGSGVLVKVDSGWKIKQYVLSMTMPNDSIESAIKIKAPIEDSMIQKLQNK